MLSKSCNLLLPSLPLHLHAHFPLCCCPSQRARPARSSSYSSSAAVPAPCRHILGRSYTSQPSHTNEADLLWWPEAVKPHKSPTPYQVLRCSKHEAYTKQRFYALVKLYHPDRCHPASPVASLPLHVRLERYRMLIAAHDILSDVEKRKAYDAWGHGWVGHHNSPSTHHRGWEYDARRWTTDPRTNATWEDWERWHQENDGSYRQSEQRTIHMSNFAFISLIFAFVSVGGVVQGTRFTTFNNSVIERRDQIHREASIEYRRSRNASMNGQQDERIRTFLEHREANIDGEQSYQRLLPPSESCAPDQSRRQ